MIRTANTSTLAANSFSYYTYHRSMVLQLWSPRRLFHRYKDYSQTSRSHVDIMLIWASIQVTHWNVTNTLLSLTICINDLEIQVHVSSIRDREFDFFLEIILYRARISIRSSCIVQTIHAHLWKILQNIYIPQWAHLFISDYGPFNRYFMIS